MLCIRSSRWAQFVGSKVNVVPFIILEDGLEDFVYLKVQIWHWPEASLCNLV